MTETLRHFTTFFTPLQQHHRRLSSDGPVSNHGPGMTASRVMTLLDPR
jgi:hypothetical protein